MTTLIAVLQFLTLQGITLNDFTIEMHDYYYSDTPCQVFKDKDTQLIVVCAEEKKLLVVKKGFIE